MRVGGRGTRMEGLIIGPGTEGWKNLIAFFMYFSDDKIKMSYL